MNGQVKRPSFGLRISSRLAGFRISAFGLRISESFWICLLLASLTAACFWPITSHQFVSIDDHQYIRDNPRVRQGLTWAGVAWAFRSGYACNWHPLTWISHMLDCQLYSLNPGGHHFTNLLFHVANTVLVFLVLQQMTGRKWPSAAVAAFFGCHPLHVESVAWASERKDVLSTFFFLLTLLAYVRYVERAEGRREKGEGKGQSEGKRSTFNVQRPTSNVEPPNGAVSSTLDVGR